MYAGAPNHTYQDIRLDTKYIQPCCRLVHGPWHYVGTVSTTNVVGMPMHVKHRDQDFIHKCEN